MTHPELSVRLDWLERNGDPANKDDRAIALAFSIEKWRQIVAGTMIDGGDTNCGLCRLHLENCETCPVYPHTSIDPEEPDRQAGQCEGTPYDRWRKARWNAFAEIAKANKGSKEGMKFSLNAAGGYDYSMLPTSIAEEMKAAAQAELDFLIGLRDE